MTRGGDWDNSRLIIKEKLGIEDYQRLNCGWFLKQDKAWKYIILGHANYIFPANKLKLETEN